MISRKGVVGEGLLHPISILIMIIIALGIIGGINSFFNEEYDYRMVEASSLLEKVETCFNRESFFDLKSDLNKSEFLDKCKISSDVLEDGKHLVYMKNKNGVEFSIGVTDFKNRCFFIARGKNLNLPLCKELNLTTGDYLLAASSQHSARILS